MEDRTLAEVATLQRALAVSYRGPTRPDLVGDWQKGRAQGVEEAVADFEASFEVKLPKRLEALIQDVQDHVVQPPTIWMLPAEELLRRLREVQEAKP
jgi:hypothetical protein